MLKFEINNEVPEVQCEEVQRNLGQVQLIDVRGPDEYHGELGHIESSQLVELGPALQEFLEEGKYKDETVIFICRSGARSARATLLSRELGYKNTFNMQGGMLRWNSLELPIKK